MQLPDVDTQDVPTPDLSQPVRKKPAYRVLFSPENYLFLGIAIIGLAFRWSNLLALPIFADEAVHIQGGLAAQTGKLNTEGLFNLIWTSRVIHGWFIGVIYFLFDNSNLLLWGRIFSGLCGLVTILTCYKIGTLLYSNRAGLLAAAFWAITPFTLWHERLILVDPLLATFTGLVIYFSIVLTRLKKGRQSNYYAIFLGLSLAAAFLTKFSAALILPVPVLAVLLLAPRAKWKSFIPRYFLAYYLAGLLVLPVLILNRNYIGSYQREKQITLPTIALIGEHLSDIADWLYTYLSLPLVVLLVVSIAGVFVNKQKPGLFLLLSALIPLVSQGVFLSVSYSRYILFILIPLFVVAAGQLDQGLNWLLAKKPAYSRLIIPVLIILALPMLWLDYQIVIDPYTAALPQADRIQYIQGPWSGTGIAEVKTFLENEQAKSNKSLVVFTTLTIPSLGLEVELYRNTHFKLVQVDLIPNVDYVRLNEAFEDLPAYLVAMTPVETALIEEYQHLYPNLDFVSVLTVPKPGNITSWQIYRLVQK